MSVQSEITRLENAKAAIKNAIEGKGVTVPDATLLDGMATLIESIEAGGGEAENALNEFIARISSNTLEELNSNMATPISAAWGRSLTNLKRINLPNCPGTSATNTWYAFSGANWEEINMPSAYRLGSRTFSGSKAGTKISFPSLAEMGSENFMDCSALKTAEFGREAISGYGATIAAKTFSGTALDTLILRASDRIWALGNVSAFSGTPIESGSGYIYVPSTLLDEYKAATNWSTFENQFRAIEDYPEITGGTT